MKFFKEHSIFICILIVCAVLRLLPLFDYQFTFDELSGMERTQFSSFSELIEKGVKIDAHPAFVQLLIYYLVKTFGYVTWIVKLPFLLFSFGAIIYAYAFGLRNFSKQAGLFSAVIFSFSLIFVFYAPIARMYISGVFFSIALLYYFFEIFFHKDLRISNYILLGLFALLSALNQHINSLFAFTVCASGFLFLTKETSKAYLICCLLTVLAYLPHIPVTLYQLSVPGIGRDAGGWLEVPEFKVFFTFLKVLFGTGKTYLVFLFLIALSIILNRKNPLNKKRIFLLALFILNFLVVYLYSIWRSPIFQYSVMLFSGAALVLFVCSLLEFTNRIIFQMALLLVTSVLLYKSYFKKDYLHQSVKTVYEYQFERSLHYKNLYGDKNVCPIFFDADNIMKKIYFEKYHTKFDCKISSDSLISNMDRTYYTRDLDPLTGQPNPGQQISSLRLFSEYIAGLKCDYLILSSAMPHFQAIVKDYFPYLLENTQTQAINFKLYSRNKADKIKVVEDDKVDYFSSWNEKGKFDYPYPFISKIDSLNEYPFGAKANLYEVTSKEGQVVLLKAKIKPSNRNSQLEACITMIGKEDHTLHYYNSKAANDFVVKDSLITIYSELFNGSKYSNIKYNSDLNAYLWNRGKENFELKDFEIRVIDYWPRKWDWWD